MKCFPLAIGMILVVVFVNRLSASTIYTHSFADLHDITVVQGSPSLTPNVPAPGGKGSIALQFDDASGSDGVANLQPSGVVIPVTGATATFRIYITSKVTGTSKLIAAYSHGPGEGLKFLDGGVLGNSAGGSFPGSWGFNNWYTVGLYVDSSTNVSIYFKQGANAQLTAADLIGGPVGGVYGAMIRTNFFNYGGQYYVADYTLNSGFDLTTVPTVPEPTSALLLALGALSCVAACNRTDASTSTARPAAASVIPAQTVVSK